MLVSNTHIIYEFLPYVGAFSLISVMNIIIANNNMNMTML